MSNPDHGFYLLLSYGAASLLLAAEGLLLWLRCRRAHDLRQHERR